jgi:hypothetical protein
MKPMKALTSLVGKMRSFVKRSFKLLRRCLWASSFHCRGGSRIRRKRMLERKDEETSSAAVGFAMASRKGE